MSNGKSSTRRNVVYETSASFKVAQLMSHFAILLKLPSFKSYFPRHGTHLVSLQFSCSVMSGSLQPHGLQHARLPCPSQTPRVYSNSGPLSRWCHPSSHPLSSPSPTTFNLSQNQGLFKRVNSTHQVARVLEFYLQHQSFQWIFRTHLL